MKKIQMATFLAACLFPQSSALAQIPSNGEHLTEKPGVVRTDADDHETLGGSALSGRTIMVRWSLIATRCATTTGPGGNRFLLADEHAARQDEHHGKEAHQRADDHRQPERADGMDVAGKLGRKTDRRRHADPENIGAQHAEHLPERGGRIHLFAQLAVIQRRVDHGRDADDRDE